MTLDATALERAALDQACFLVAANVLDPQEFSDQEFGLYLSAKAGDYSAPASDYLTRSGVLEVFVPGLGVADTAAVQQRARELAEARTREVFAVDAGRQG